MLLLILWQSWSPELPALSLFLGLFLILVWVIVIINFDLLHKDLLILLVLAVWQTSILLRLLALGVGLSSLGILQ